MTKMNHKHNIGFITSLIALIILGSFSFAYCEQEEVPPGLENALSKLEELSVPATSKVQEILSRMESHIADFIRSAKIEYGEATFDAPNPTTLNVIASTEKLILTSNSFSIAQEETVNFIQPQIPFASVLMRILGNEISQIDGTLTATGNLIIVNPTGITFGPTANVNVASLIASTLDISNQDFLNGLYKFFKNGKDTFLINEGKLIIRNGGYVCLLSQALKNTGAIQAELGTVVLASGEKTTLALDDLNEISVVIEDGVKDEVLGPDGNKMTSAIENTGTISANGGKVILTANVLNKVFDYSINNSGIIEAKNLVDHNGVVELVATGAPIYNIGKIEAGAVTVQAPDTEVINQGQIIVDGTPELPNAGILEIQAATVLQQGIITANAQEGGTAGEITIVSTTSTVLDEGSSTEARALGIVGQGGRILINSTGGNTVVNKGAVIDVSAGAIAGNAGFIEISAFDQLGFYGVLNGRAPPGYNPATVLFDPTNIIIQTGGVPTITNPINYTDSPTNLTIDPSALQSFNGVLIQLHATNNITLVSSLIIYNPNTSLSLEAGHDIWINANLIVNGNIYLIADASPYRNNDGDFHQAANKIIAAAGDIRIEGKNLYLDEIYFGGTNFDAVASGKIEVNDLIQSAAVMILGGGGGTVILLYPTDDSYTKESNRGSNWGWKNTLTVSSGAGNVRDWIWLKFDLRGIPDDAIISDSTLELNGQHDQDGIIVSVYHGNDYLTGLPNGIWNEDNIVWDNQPTTNDSTSDDSVTNPTRDWNSWTLSGTKLQSDLSDDISTWVLKSENIDPDDTNLNPMNFWSKDSNHQPKLVLTYTSGMTGYTIGATQDGTITLTAKDDVIFKNVYSGGGWHPSLISQGRLETLGDVYVTSQTDAIIDQTGTYINIIADNLVLSAKDGIGSSDPLDTRVSYLQAKNTHSGNIKIINSGTPTLTLKDISVWGFAVRNFGSGIVSISVHSDLIVDAPVYANNNVYLSANDNIFHNANGDVAVDGGDFYGDAGSDYILYSGSSIITEDGIVDIEAGDNIRLFGALVKSETTNDGPAKVIFDADNEIELDSSTVQAIAQKYGWCWFGSAYALVDFYTKYGDIILRGSGSDVLAQVNRGDATVKFDAGDDIRLNHSTVEATVDDWGTALVDFDARGVCWHRGDIIINNDSSILADVNWGHAEVDMDAEDDIEVTDSIIAALVDGDLDTAVVELYAGDSITITGSGIYALNLYGPARIFFLAVHNIDLVNSGLYSEALGDATIILKSLWGNIELENSLIRALATGDSEVDLIAWNGSILGDATSLINAEFLGLLARYDIGTGTSTTPINTQVIYLSAYSWDTGDIYINELTDIELGFYFVGWHTAIGASVAANNGIIHIVANGDIIVNSVIAPRGGVYLLTNNGSIYAGTGWCPAVTDRAYCWLSGPEFFDYLKDKGPMSLSGTPWKSEGGRDYFYPIVINPVLTGPNVIAGGYSYFSAPNGSIGVGHPGDDSIDISDSPIPFDPSEYNPLYVCIQVIDGSHSALPDGVSPLAGLVMNIGGAAPLTIFGPNGPLGVSGLIIGVVRPGTISVNGDDPSPALYPSIVIDAGAGLYYPPGYVFYNDSAEHCCPPFDGSIPANIWAQIWPPLPQTALASTSAPYLVLRWLFPILEKMGGITGVQVNPVDMITSDLLARSTFYYHPLTETDMAAFDSVFSLGEGAYEFINGNINILGHDGLLPILEDAKKKKKQTI